MSQRLGASPDAMRAMALISSGLSVAVACYSVRTYPGCDHAGWSSSVARWAHNPEVAGSNPAPATKGTAGQTACSEGSAGPSAGVLAPGYRVSRSRWTDADDSGRSSVHRVIAPRGHRHAIRRKSRRVAATVRSSAHVHRIVPVRHSPGSTQGRPQGLRVSERPGTSRGASVIPPRKTLHIRVTGSAKTTSPRVCPGRCRWHSTVDGGEVEPGADNALPLMIGAVPSMMVTNVRGRRRADTTPGGRFESVLQDCLHVAEGGLHALGQFP